MLVGDLLGKGGDALALLCPASSPPSTDSPRLQWFPFGSRHKMHGDNFVVLSSHVSECTNMLSRYTHFFLPFLLPRSLFHSLFFQFEATAGYTAISAGRTDVAPQASEAAQECETGASSWGAGDAGDRQSCRSAQVGLTYSQKHNNFSTVETPSKLQLVT